MASFRVRPKFEMKSQKTPEKIIALVKDKLKQNLHHLQGQAMHDHITIRVERAQRHYWSPQLSIIMYREPEDSETKIIGVYGPMPNVWTLFTVVYLAIFVLSIFISIIGFSQKALGYEYKILWILPVFAIIALSMYMLSQFGQKLGAAQTYAIHYFFEEAIGETLPSV
ncbi:MAG: hypothetical protein IPO92_01655 [Saprospiraceae bacterium]|nr:hypothetical protein [Saprospiraceae bacterium]